MAQYDSTLGIQLIGTWINSLLFMLVLTKAWDYFAMYPKDSRLVKNMVIVSLIGDTICTCAGFSSIYYYTIKNFGHPPTQNTVQASILIAASIISSDTTRLFLIRRYWGLSKNKAITMFLLFTVLCVSGGLVSTAVELYTSNEVSNSHETGLLISVKLAVVSSMVCDLGIATALVGNSVKPDLTQRGQLRGVMISRISRYAMINGLADSSVALLLLLAFLVASKTNLDVGVTMFSSRFYTLTMLANLLSRTTREQEGDRDVVITPGNISLHAVGSARNGSSGGAHQVSAIVFRNTVNETGYSSPFDESKGMQSVSEGDTLDLQGHEKAQEFV